MFHITPNFFLIRPGVLTSATFAMTEIQRLAVVNKYYPALQHVCVIQVIPRTTKQKYGN